MQLRPLPAVDLHCPLQVQVAHVQYQYNTVNKPRERTADWNNFMVVTANSHQLQLNWKRSTGPTDWNQGLLSVIKPLPKD